MRMLLGVLTNPLRKLYENTGFVDSHFPKYRQNLGKTLVSKNRYSRVFYAEIPYKEVPSRHLHVQSY